MNYVPALDGIRAVAIVVVLVFHVVPDLLPGGFIGVDVFFVLSGFLITSTILHDLKGQEFSLGEFYLRRIQRLAPNSVITVAFTVAFAVWFFPASVARSAATHGLWTIFNGSNFYIWRNVGGYWGDSAANTPLLHTWSLAVEEQFYLLFPPAFFLLFRRARLAWTALAALGSFSFYAVWSASHPAAAFYLLPTRAWQPLVGAALAIYRFQRVEAGAKGPQVPAILSGALGLGGIALIVGGCLGLHDSTLPWGVSGLIPAAGALGVLFAIDEKHPNVVAVFSTRPMVWVGRLSYSFYLWHWPLIVFARQYAELSGKPSADAPVWGLVVGVCLATAAYYLVEQPLRRRGAGRARRLGAIAGAFAACALACIAVLRGVHIGAPTELFARPEFAGRSYSAGGNGPSGAQVGVRYADVDFPPLEPRPPDLWRTGGVVHPWGSGVPRVVVLGSSHALMYGKVLDEICRDANLSVAFLSIDATPVYFPAQGASPDILPNAAAIAEFDEARRKWISTWKPDVTIVVDRWDGVGSDMGEFQARLEVLLGAIRPASRKVVFVEQVPVLPVGESINLREYGAWYRAKFGTLPTLKPDGRQSVREAAHAVLARVAAMHADVEVVGVQATFLRQDGSVRWFEGNQSLYADDDHLSSAGAELLRDKLREPIVRLTPPGAKPSSVAPNSPR